MSRPGFVAIGFKELPVLADCSDAAVRLWLFARAFNDVNLTDGELGDRDLLAVGVQAGLSVESLNAAARELVKRKIWEKCHAGWLDPRHCDHNQPAATREKLRAQWRDYKAGRAHPAGEYVPAENQAASTRGTATVSTLGTGPDSKVGKQAIPRASVPIPSVPIPSVPIPSVPGRQERTAQAVRDPDDPPDLDLDPDDIAWAEQKRQVDQVRTAARHREDYQTDLVDRLPADAEPVLTSDLAKQLMAKHEAGG